MKKFCTYTSILITFWMLLGCTINEYKKEIFQLDFSEALKPDKEIKFLSSIASGIDFVPLETKQESLIGRIYNILKIPGGYLIQDSQKQLLFFFNDGTYGWKIESKGVGPNEFNSLTSFDYNYSKQEVLIQSRNDLFYYDLDGNLLRTIKIEKRLNNIKCLRNGNIIGISTNPETTDILTISPEGDIINEFVKNNKKTDESPIIQSLTLLDRYDSQVIFMNRDTVWQTINGLDYTPIVKMTNSTEGEPLSIRKYFKTYYLIVYSFDRIRTFINITNGDYIICHGTDKYGLIDDLFEGPPIYPGIENNGLMINYIPTYSIIRGEINFESIPENTRLKLLAIDENSNPILRVIHLKKQIDIK